MKWGGRRDEGGKEAGRERERERGGGVGGEGRVTGRMREGRKREGGGGSRERCVRRGSCCLPSPLVYPVV